MKNKNRTRKTGVAFTHSRKPAFEPNAFYERVLNLRTTDQRAFDSLAPATKQALYAYETAKREAARLSAIRDETDAA